MIKTPEWYFKSKTKNADVLSNLGFIIAGIVAFRLGYTLLGFSLVMVSIGSTFFWGNPSEKTLRIDRSFMILAFAIFYNMIYPISVLYYLVLGYFTLYLSILDDNLLYYIMYQILGIGMIIGRFGVNFWIILYLAGIISQQNYPYFAFIKHLLMSIAIIGFLVYYPEQLSQISCS